MTYVIKIKDLTGEGKPDLYYAEPRDMRRALVADINQAKKYATEDEAYDEIDDSDVAELVVDYGYYTWESDINGDVDDVDEVPGDAIDIITESKSLKDIRQQMKRLVEDINSQKYVVRYIEDHFGGIEYNPFMYVDKVFRDKNGKINNFSIVYINNIKDFEKVMEFDEKEAKEVVNLIEHMPEDIPEDGIKAGDWTGYYGLIETKEYAMNSFI